MHNPNQVCGGLCDHNLPLLAQAHWLHLLGVFVYSRSGKRSPLNRLPAATHAPNSARLSRFFKKGGLVIPVNNRTVAAGSATAQMTKIIEQVCNQMSRCAAHVQRLMELGCSSDVRRFVEFKPLACNRKKSSEAERSLAWALHNARSAKSLDDRSVAYTVFASRRLSTRTRLSQLVPTCTLVMLLLASLHSVDGDSIATCLPPLCTPALSLGTCQSHAHITFCQCHVSAAPAKVPTNMPVAVMSPPHTIVVAPNTVRSAATQRPSATRTARRQTTAAP